VQEPGSGLEFRGRSSSLLLSKACRDYSKEKLAKVLSVNLSPPSQSGIPWGQWEEAGGLDPFPFQVQIDLRDPYLIQSVQIASASLPFARAFTSDNGLSASSTVIRARPTGG